VTARFSIRIAEASRVAPFRSRQDAFRHVVGIWSFKEGLMADLKT
jgi:hypothetical protein